MGGRSKLGFARLATRQEMHDGLPIIGSAGILPASLLPVTGAETPALPDDSLHRRKGPAGLPPGCPDECVWA
jgi:hypothetical protein